MEPEPDIEEDPVLPYLKTARLIATEAWDGWQNWMLGDSVSPRLDSAVDAVSRYYLGVLEEAEWTRPVYVEFSGGPIDGQRQFKTITEIVMVRAPDQNVNDRTGHIYRYSSARNLYYYLGPLTDAF